MDNVDFLPEKIRRQRAMRTRLKLQIYVVGLLAAFLVAIACFNHGKIAAAQAQLAAHEERSSIVKQQLGILTNLQKQQAQLMLSKRVDDMFLAKEGTRIRVIDVLAEVGKLLPEGISLQDLNCETMDVTLEKTGPAIGGPYAGGDNKSASPVQAQAPASGAAGAGKPGSIKRVKLVLTGLAPTDVDVANFIGQLSASPLFEDVNMGYAKNVMFRGKNGKEFSVSCYVAR
jgi:Tfp pilus assembly protein PilN